MSDTIQVVVRDDMRLLVHPHEVGRDAENNSALFQIRQPPTLDPYVCRAEVRTNAGRTYRLVEDGQFSLTSDIAVAGRCALQLVYSDAAGTVTRKTELAAFHINPSVNAVDPEAPGHADGLAQLQAAAFCRVDVAAGVVRFYNFSGQQVGQIELPGSIEDLDRLYLRLDGVNRMEGSLVINGPQRGIVFDAMVSAPIIYSDGLALRLRRAIGNTDVTIEDSSGASASRSPIMTLATSDGHYLRKDGGQMDGPLITARGTSPTNPGIGIGDNTTGFYRSGNALQLAVAGALYMQFLASPQEVMSVYPINMATQRITNVGNATAAGDAVSRSFGDSRYLQVAVGGIVAGPMQLLSPPIIATDVATKNYVDQRRAPFLLFDVPVPTWPIASDGSWVNLYSASYAIERGGSSYVRVTLSLSFLPWPASIYTLRARLLNNPHRTFWFYGNHGIEVVLYGQVTGTNPVVTVQLSVGNPPPGNADLVVVGAPADDRSQIGIEDLGPVA